MVLKHSQHREGIPHHILTVQHCTMNHSHQCIQPFDIVPKSFCHRQSSQNCATESECCKLIHCYWTPFMATLWYLQLMDHRLDMPDKIILLYYFNSNTTMITFIHSLLVKFTRAQWKQSFHGWMFFCLIWDNSDVEGEEQANFTGLIQLDFYYWYCYFPFSLSQPGLYSSIVILREGRGHVTWWVDFPGEGRK